MSTALARKFRVDLTSDLTLAGGWLQLNGINDLKPDVSPNMVDTSAYDTDGWDSMEITGNAWSLVAGFFRRKDGAGVYDPAQELARARIGQFGDSARVGVRWYDKDGSTEAYQGVAIVKWEKGQTGVKDVETVTLTLTGDGALQTIANPGTAATAPVVTSALPSGAAAGELVEIHGSGFTGATAVKFGATAAADYVVNSDSLITASMPAGTAGSAAVTVTNAVGVSNSLAYTRGA